jgi:hypothetical protein
MAWREQLELQVQRLVQQLRERLQVQPQLRERLQVQQLVREQQLVQPQLLEREQQEQLLLLFYRKLPKQQQR